MVTYSAKRVVKGIVHFEIKFCYVLAYLKGIQDVGVFVSTVFSILIIFGSNHSVKPFFFLSFLHTQNNNKKTSPSILSYGSKQRT